MTSVHPVGTDTEFFGVAEAKTGVKRPVSDREVRQTANTVSRKTVRAIVKPRAEVWPLRASRWVLNLQTFLPSVTDRVMARYFKQIDDLNRP